MKTNLTPNHFSLALAAGLALSALSTHAQDVVVTGSMTDVALGGGSFAFTLTLQNTGTEAINSLWLGWALSANPIFNVLNPSAVGNNLGWASVIDSDSVQYGTASDTPLGPGGKGIFTFTSTSTPAQFMMLNATGGAGASVAYGVDASPFAIEDTTLHSFEFAPTLTATPEPSTLGLVAISSLGLLGAVRRKWRA